MYLKGYKLVHLLFRVFQCVFLEEVIIRIKLLIDAADMNFERHYLQVHVVTHACKMINAADISIFPG